MFKPRPQPEILFDNRLSIIKQDTFISDSTGIIGIYGQGTARRIVIERVLDSKIQPKVFRESQSESNRQVSVYELTFGSVASSDIVNWRVVRVDDHSFPALSLQCQSWRKNADSLLECQVTIIGLDSFEHMMEQKINRDLPHESQDRDIQEALEQIGQSIEWKKNEGWCSIL